VAVLLAAGSDPGAQSTVRTPSAEAYYQFLLGRHYESAGETDKASLAG
jgi:hypothetical protein